MTERPKVVVAEFRHSESRHWSRAAREVLDSFADWTTAGDGSELDARLADAEALLYCGWGNLGHGDLTEERLARAPRLRFIGSTCHYRQAEWIDMAAARARGIAFSETAPIMSPWVAEYALGLALAALRRIPQEHAVVGSGEWIWTFDHDPMEWPDRLEGRRVGLVSFGEIHRHLSRYLSGFGCDWQAYDPFVPAERIAAAGGQQADDIVAMARRSEVLFIATPPNPQTIGLISRDVIEALPPGAVFVLVSRMAVVEQPPLIARLQRGDLRAAIDVYAPEPPEPDSPLRHLPNLVHTPHRAGNTRGAHNGVFLEQCREARRHFSGESLLYPLREELVALFQR